MELLLSSVTLLGTQYLPYVVRSLCYVMGWFILMPWLNYRIYRIWYDFETVESFQHRWTWAHAVEDIRAGKIITTH